VLREYYEGDAPTITRIAEQMGFLSAFFDLPENQPVMQ
jgi:hypothetical protein